MKPAQPLLWLALLGHAALGHADDCGESVDDALRKARQSEDAEQRLACIETALERLAAHVENLRTGAEAFGEIRANAYLHEESRQ